MRGRLGADQHEMRRKEKGEKRKEMQGLVRSLISCKLYFLRLDGSSMSNWTEVRDRDRICKRDDP